MGCGVVRGRASPSKIDSAAAEPLTLAVTRSYRRGSCSDHQPSRAASRAFSEQPRGSTDGSAIDRRARVPQRKCGFSFYLRAPDARIGAGMGAKEFPNALPAVGTLGRGAAGPVFLHVRGTFVVPTVAGYEPTEGAVTVPYPPSPGACASANVLVRVKAAARIIVLNFMSFPSCCLATSRRKIDVSGIEVNGSPQNKTRRGERRAWVG
jgi:hypothetical protein